MSSEKTSSSSPRPSAAAIAIALKRSELHPPAPPASSSPMGDLIEQWEGEIARGKLCDADGNPIDAAGVPRITARPTDPQAE
jgi:hypothetical protein